MNAEQPFSDEEISRVKTYASDVLSVFRAQFSDAANRFSSSEPLLRRFAREINNVLANGSSYFHAVDEAHNELCIASALLLNSTPRFSRLAYEPLIAGCAKTIDFRAISDDGLTVFVDVKTIEPGGKDRFDQYQKALRENWLPHRVNLILPPQYYGGEEWHNMVAARSRMLEHTLEFEEKIDSGKLKANNTVLVLAFCANSFSWHESELEDFVSFYFTGIHRPDDPFSSMEAKHINEGKIALARTISRFAYMFRPRFDSDCSKLNCDVQPPKRW